MADKKHYEEMQEKFNQMKEKDNTEDMKKEAEK